MMEAPPTLTFEQVAGLLESVARTIRAEAEPLGDEGMRWHPAPGEWCANEVIGHILEAERRGFAGRIRLIIEQPGRKLQGWDQEQVARDRRDCDRDGASRHFARQTLGSVPVMRSPSDQSSIRQGVSLSRP